MVSPREGHLKYLIGNDSRIQKLRNCIYNWLVTVSNQLTSPGISKYSNYKSVSKYTYFFHISKNTVRLEVIRIWRHHWLIWRQYMTATVTVFNKSNHHRMNCQGRQVTSWDEKRRESCSLIKYVNRGHLLCSWLPVGVCRLPRYSIISQISHQRNSEKAMDINVSCERLSSNGRNKIVREALCGNMLQILQHWYKLLQSEKEGWLIEKAAEKRCFSHNLARHRRRPTKTYTSHITELHWLQNISRCRWGTRKESG